jgi:diguanylate cyclase (GGDEF)-like protein/PAS domain S-box-containing protein
VDSGHGIGPGSQAAVLVVDDSSSKRLAIAAVIEELGHRVVEASSGEAALEAVTTQAFAVILMDVQMPVIDGYETAQLIRMRKEYEHTPIIFITANARDEAAIPAAYASGAVDLIFAPIAPHILRAKVSVFVDLFLKSRDLKLSLNEVTLLGNQFRDSEARTRAVLENVADGIVTLTDDGVIESFNRAASTLFGYTEQEAIGQPFRILLAPEARRDFVGRRPDSLHLAALQPRAGRMREMIGCRKDGSAFAMELDFSNLPLDSRNIHVGCLRDVSQRRTYTERLEHAAQHDPLTELPNRVLFADRVAHAIRGASRKGEPLALLLMDLDGFKEVNDTFGHKHGDDLLRAVAGRLVACLRDGDTVARLGGDEFGILPLGPTTLAGAASIAWKLQQALEQPFVVGDSTLKVRASIGMALIPEHGDNIDDLLRRADLAMYEAKASEVGYRLFTREQEEAPARRLELIVDLQRAVERGEFTLHYQPKIDLTTRKAIGVEALIRWNHPSGALLPPCEFMPEIEASELMLPVTEWVINEALRTLSGWRREGYDLTMAVNVGARCLDHGTGFLDTVDDLLTAWGVQPEHLTLELTESAFIDTALPGLLERLQHMAPRLSIDDFGTGYSSLTYLQRLPVTELKADRSFVSGVSSVEADAVIVRSIIDLAHNLGVTVVAEGVEDQATMTQLIEYGCDVAQGFHFGRPVPRLELTAWLDSSPFGPARSADGVYLLAV